jgi:hypothetical protein
MTYQPNDVEWQALDLIALALRPDWKSNKPGPTWFTKTGGTLPHAENFIHSVDALIHYATDQKDGKHVKRTPNLYPESGVHWESTKPKIPPKRREPCEDHPENDAGADNCTQCWADIKAGQKPHKYLGKKYENQETVA